MTHCWTDKLTHRAIIINLLVCRLQRHINVNRTTRTLLKIIRPKLQRVASNLLKDTTGNRSDAADIMAELEAQTIEQLMHHYVMGEKLHPLRWLFSHPSGAITRWGTNYRRAMWRRQRAEVLVDSEVLDQRATEDDAPVEYDQDAESRARTLAAMQLVRDGLTFPLHEYRVLRFFLRNAAEEGAKPHFGLATVLANATGMSRKTVELTYTLATRRLLDWSGQAPKITVPAPALNRRYQRMLRTPSRARSNRLALSLEEIVQMLEACEEHTVANVAWAYGISEALVYRMRREFKGLSAADIQAKVTAQ